MPELDVVIPAYVPDSGLLRRAIESASGCIRMLSGDGCIIVIDDGSPEPLRLDASWGGGVAIDLIRQSNAGPSTARNTGLERSSARWVLLLDADDEAIAEGVRAMVELGRTLGASCVVGARLHVYADGSTSPRTVPTEWAGRALPQAGDVFKPIGLFGASACLVSAMTITRGVRFDASLRIGEDRDFLRRCADVGPIGICADMVLRTTMHDTQSGDNLTSSRHIDRRIDDHLRLCAKWLDASSRAHFEDATRWLINASAKGRASERAWRELMNLAHAQGFAVPLKARVRRVFRRPSAVEGSA